ncbi:hypothetical protein DBR42_17230 [Pelomonas sp. HMWF004]|nr:hypothetical protein DBR42_17230 [Pelomonas sp. HMWF004]
MSATSEPDTMQPHTDNARRVARWAFDAGTARIHAFDAHGQVVMAIPACPLFGLRLAAAFGMVLPANRVSSQSGE